MVTLKEPTRRILVGTAGHIDHGKTSLVKLFTGCETDRLPEEKRRGMSIDLGFASCMMGRDLRLGIVDVPGHEKFIRNMVAGVAAIDMILLVVAADDGVMPQTREHLQIVELLGLQTGMVALTKIDMVDPELAEMAREDVEEFLKGTFLEGAPIVPVSSATGQGYDVFWETLHDTAMAIEPRGPRGVFRMPVERTFSVKGLGTVVTGMPLTGLVRLEDRLELLPEGIEARVRGIQVFAQEARRAMAGDCVALNVPDVDRKQLRRGQILGQPGFFRPTTLVDARVQVLPLSSHALKDGAPVRFHTGTSEVMGRTALLDCKRVEPGGSALAQFRLEEPVVVAARDRFVVRLQSPAVTVGGGMVIREQERKLKRFRSQVLEDLARTEQAIETEAGAVEHALLGRGSKPSRPRDLEKASRLPLDDVNEALKDMGRRDLLVALPGDLGVLHREAYAAAVAQVEAVLSGFHDLNPLRGGMARTALRQAAGLERAVFDFLVQREAAAGLLELSADVAGLKARQPAMDPETKARLERAEALFRDGAFAPPSAAQLAEALSADEAGARGIVEHLADRGVLVKVAEDMFFHRDTVARAQETLVGHLRAHGEIGAVTFRDLVGGSRKFVYPLLDYFDVKGVTVRRGNLRYLKEVR